MADDIDHLIECGADWQYCIVFWLALDSEPYAGCISPDGRGWHLNRAIGKSGVERVKPSWSDGSIVMYRVHWHRWSPGMRHWHMKSVVRENRREWFVGSQVPDRLLAELGSEASVARRPRDPDSNRPATLDNGDTKPAGRQRSKRTR